MKRLIALFIILFSISTEAQVPTGYDYEVLSGSYPGAMCSVFTSDGQYMLTATRRGKIYVSDFNGTTYIRRSTEILDIEDEIVFSGELGLLSIAIDPEDDSRILAYGVYERSVILPDAPPQALVTPTIARVVAYELDYNGNITTDESVIIGQTHDTGIPITQEQHAGGTILFASDGSVFLSTGETGAGTTAQAVVEGIMREAERTRFRAMLLNGMNGKILRFDKTTGLGLPDNPFYDPEYPNIPRSKVWAMGLRNPFRMAINLESDILYIADVGPNSNEEINVFDVPALNGGWARYTGYEFHTLGDQLNLDTGNSFYDEIVPSTSFNYDPDFASRIGTHKPPDLVYPHQNENPGGQLPAYMDNTLTPEDIPNYTYQGNTVIAGVVIQGDDFGPDMNGAFLFSDIYPNTGAVAYQFDGERYFNDVETFFENVNVNNAFSGVIHYTQHPITGDVYMTTLFNRVTRVFYDETLSIMPSVYDSDSIKYYTLSSYLKIKKPVDIYNLAGQKVLTVNESDIINLKTGLYIVEDGRTSLVISVK